MYYAAIMMGLAGSMHCAGMCSPLAMAVTRSRPFVISNLLYNSGRIFVYAILGLIAASAGSFVHLNSYQQIISVMLAVGFLLAGFNMTSMKIPFLERGMAKANSKLKRAFGEFLGRKSNVSTFILGMINGMLPCGLTYMALSACLILPKASDGFLFMMLFGFGTWPMMIGLVKIFGQARWMKQFSMARLSKIVLVFIGCTLLVRVWWIHPHSVSTAKSPLEVVCK